VSKSSSGLKKPITGIASASKQAGKKLGGVGGQLEGAVGVG
jgi:hypothetical protein